MIGGSRLGSIIARSKEGRWRVHSRTGQLDAILHVAPYETTDHLAVAVGELGTLIKVRRGKGVDPINRGNLPLGTYIFIDGIPNGNRWFIGVQTKDKAALYETNQLESGNWRLVYEDTILPSQWSGLRGVWLWRYNGRVGYASTASNQISCFNYTSGQWIRNPTPNNRGLLAVAAGPTYVIGALTQAGGGFAGVFAKTHYSKDCGATWIETNSPYSVKASPPLVLPSGQILESGGVFGDKGVYRSDDGQAWKKVTDEVVIFNDNLWVLPNVGILSVSRGQFGYETIRRSIDGEKWTTELVSLDMNLLKREKEAQSKTKASGGTNKE